MQDYSWMKNAEPKQPVSVEAVKGFRLSQAAYADEQVAYWTKEGDKLQAERWAAEADDLRREAAA